MAGTGDFFADEYAPMQQVQMPNYWGAPAGCEYTACEVAYPTAPNHVATHPYGGQSFAGQSYGGHATAPAPQVYGQSVPHYYGNQGHQSHSGHIQYGQPQYGQAQYGQPQYGQAQYGHIPAYVNSRHGTHKGLRQAYTYGSIGATLYDVDSELFGVQGRLGWQSKSILGAEVEGSYGFNEDDAAINVGGTLLTAETGIDTQIAGFAVARFPLSERFNVLGRVGYHSTDIRADVTDGTTVAELDFSTDGIAYGLGAEYAIGRKTSLRADYTRYDLDGAEADALSLAIARKF